MKLFANENFYIASSVLGQLITFIDLVGNEIKKVFLIKFIADIKDAFPIRKTCLLFSK